MSNLTGSQADQTTAYIREQFQAGVSRQMIINSLVGNGWTYGDASAAVTSTERLMQGGAGAIPPVMAENTYDQALSAPSAVQSNVTTTFPGTGLPTQRPVAGLADRPSPTAARSGGRAAGARRMVIGALWFFGGLAVTIVTFAIAAENGGRYFLAWGGILWGLIDMVRGFIQFVSASD